MDRLRRLLLLFASCVVLLVTARVADAQSSQTGPGIRFCTTTDEEDRYCREMVLKIEQQLRQQRRRKRQMREDSYRRQPSANDHHGSPSPGAPPPSNSKYACVRATDK